MPQNLEITNIFRIDREKIGWDFWLGSVRNPVLAGLRSKFPFQLQHSTIAHGISNFLFGDRKELITLGEKWMSEQSIWRICLVTNDQNWAKREK